MIKITSLSLLLLSTFSFASEAIDPQNLIPLDTATSIVMSTTPICLASDHRVKRLTKNERERLSSALLFVLEGDTDKHNSEIYKGERELITRSKKHNSTETKTALFSFSIYCEPLLAISVDDLSLEREIQTNLNKMLLK